MECLLRVGVIGLNFKMAALSLRERIARATLDLSGEAGLFFPHKTVLLSTCNRTEIYFSAPDLALAHSDLLSFLRKEMNETFDQHLYSYFGINCLSHLACVTAGLDSAIVAESEIQRQVKLAYKNSPPPLPSDLHFLFQKALRVAKEIRRSFPQMPHSSSLKGVLGELVRKEGIDWKRAKTLFIGNSQISRDLLCYFRRKGMERVDLCTRGAHQGQFYSAVGRERLSGWEEYDLIVSATKTSHYLLHPKEICGRRRLIFDLGVPRNVDPALSRCPGVSLYNIEKIDQLMEQSRFAQRDYLEKCEGQIREHAARICASYRKKCGSAASELALCVL